MRKSLAAAAMICATASSPLHAQWNGGACDRPVNVTDVMNSVTIRPISRAFQDRAVPHYHDILICHGKFVLTIQDL